MSNHLSRVEILPVITAEFEDRKYRNCKSNIVIVEPLPLRPRKRQRFATRLYDYMYMIFWHS
jgi:hypothetical protein